LGTGPANRLVFGPRARTAVSVLAVVGPFGQSGVDLALIQRRTFDRRVSNTAWTTNILICAAIALALCVAATPAA
jgi:hypothetical protein